MTIKKQGLTNAVRTTTLLVGLVFVLSGCGASSALSKHGSTSPSTEPWVTVAAGGNGTSTASTTTAPPGAAAAGSTDDALAQADAGAGAADSQLGDADLSAGTTDHDTSNDSDVSDN